MTTRRLFAVGSLLSVFLVARPGDADAKLKVVCTTQDPAAITREIGGDRVSVTAFAKGFQDPHFLDAKPSYMLELNKADLLIAIGLDMEIGYLPSLVGGARNPRIAAGKPGFLDLSTVIEPIEVVANADRSQGDIHPGGNPHYWLDPENGRLIARGIAARLAELDAAGKDTYAANLATFEKTLDAKAADWAKRMEPLKGKPVVTFHRSWSYFTSRYGLDVIGYIEPRPGIPPTPSHTLQLIKTMKERGAKVILMENFYDARVPELIAGKTGAKVVGVPNSVGGDATVKTWFDLMDRIVGDLEKAVGG